MCAHCRVDRSELIIISYSVPYVGKELLGQLKISTKYQKLSESTSHKGFLRRQWATCKPLKQSFLNRTCTLLKIIICWVITNNLIAFLIDVRHKRLIQLTFGWWGPFGIPSTFVLAPPSVTWFWHTINSYTCPPFCNLLLLWNTMRSSIHHFYQRALNRFRDLSP